MRYCYLIIVIIIGAISGLNARDNDAPLIVSDSNNFAPQAPRDTIGRLDRLTVTSAKIKAPRFNTAAPAKTFTSKDISATAGTAGDLCRYIGMLPSAVSSLSEDFDNTLYVRGGRPSEVIFVVDGIEMDNINHFSTANGSGGPLGFINSDYVNKVDFYAGNAPPCLPPRLSSVVSVDLQPGSVVKYHSSLGCKLTGAMFSSQGPLQNGKSSFIIAGRYIDFSTLGYFLKDRGTPRLGDLYIKGFHLLDNNDDVSMTGLLAYNGYAMHYPIIETDDVTAQAHDNVREERESIVQGGCGVTYRAPRGIFSNKAVLFCSFRDGKTADSLYHYNDSFFTARYTENPYQADRDARLRVGLTINSDVTVNKSLTLSLGAASRYQRFRMMTKYMRQYRGNYTYCYNGAPVVLDRTETPRKLSVQFGDMESAGFGEFIAVTGGLTSSIGVRADYHRLLHAFALSPRLSLAMTVDKIGIFLAACGVQRQFPFEMPSQLFYTYSANASLDAGSAKNAMIDNMGKLHPLRCSQTSLGFRRSLASWMQMESNAYYKWYDLDCRFVTPDQQEFFYYTGNNKVDLFPQTGCRKAYGIEGTLENAAQCRLHYSLAASLFTVKNKYRDGGWYNDWANIGHALSFSCCMNFLNINFFSITAQGNGGRPYCPQTITTDCMGRKTTAYTSMERYYTEKLDPIVSVNVKYTFKKNIGKTTLELFVEALNALNDQPTLDYRFNGEEFIPIKPYGIVPIIGAEIGW